MLVLWGVTSTGLSFCWPPNTGLTRQMLSGVGVALRLAAPEGGHSVLSTGRSRPWFIPGPRMLCVPAHLPDVQRLGLWPSHPLVKSLLSQPGSGLSICFLLEADVSCGEPSHFLLPAAGWALSPPTCLWVNGSRTCRSVGLSYVAQHPPPPCCAPRLSFISQAQGQAHPCRMAAGSSPTLGGFQGCVCPSTGQGPRGPGISRGCLDGFPTEALLQRWPAWGGLWLSPGKGCWRVKQGRAISPMFTSGYNSSLEMTAKVPSERLVSW